MQQQRHQQQPKPAQCSVFILSLRLVDALCFVHVVADGACGEVPEHL